MYRGKTPYVLSVVVTDGVYDGNRPVDRHSKPLEKKNRNFNGRRAAGNRNAKNPGQHPCIRKVH